MCVALVVQVKTDFSILLRGFVSWQSNLTKMFCQLDIVWILSRILPLKLVISGYMPANLRGRREANFSGPETPFLQWKCVKRGQIRAGGKTL